MFHYLIRYKRLFLSRVALSILLVAALLASCSTTAKVDVAGAGTENQGIASGKPSTHDSSDAEAETQNNNTQADQEPTAEASATASTTQSSVPTATAEPTPRPTARPNPTATPTSEPVERIDPDTLERVRIDPYNTIVISPDAELLISVEEEVEGDRSCEGSKEHILITDLTQVGRSGVLGEVVTGYRSGIWITGTLEQVVFDANSPRDNRRMRVHFSCENAEGKQAFKFRDFFLDEYGLVKDAFDEIFYEFEGVKGGQALDQFQDDRYAIGLEFLDEQGELVHETALVDSFTLEAEVLDRQSGPLAPQSFIWSYRDEDGTLYRYADVELDTGEKSIGVFGEDNQLLSDALNKNITFTDHLSDFDIADNGRVFFQACSLEHDGCQYFTGLIAGEGLIVEAHRVFPAEIARAINSDRPEFKFDFSKEEEFFDGRAARMRSDGSLFVAGTAKRNGEREAVLFAIDLDEDPGFIFATSQPAELNEEALFEDIHGDFWVVGDDRNTFNPGCGNKTLYRTTDFDFHRVLRTINSIDEPVLLAGSAPYQYGDDVYQAVVALTACPAEYDGYRIWFGIDRIGLLRLEQFYPTSFYVNDIQAVGANWYDGAGEASLIVVRATDLKGETVEIILHE